MGLRINKAKNFAGKSYIITSQLDNLIKSVSLSGNTISFTGQTIGDETGIGSASIDLSGLTSFANKSITKAGSSVDLITVSSNAFDATGLTTLLGTVSSNAVVITDANGNFTYTNSVGTEVHASGSTNDNVLPNETAIRSAIDAVKNAAITVNGTNGITVTGDGTEKTISNTIKLVKLSSSVGDDAATYELQYQNGSSYTTLNGSDQIHIAKDQFLKSADFGWATNGDGTGWDATHTAGTNDIPVIKFVVYTTSNAGTDSAVTADKSLYIDCTTFYREYTEGNRVSITDGNKINVVVGDGIDASVTSAVTVKVDASDQVYTSKGVQAAAISVGTSGVKVQNIQTAIDLAVNNEHAKASAAIDSLSTNISSFKGAVNTQASAVVDNVNTAITSTVTSINAQVGSAITNVDNKVDSAVTKINTEVYSAITTVNTKVDSAVANVNTNVSAFKESVNSSITSTVTAVNTAVTSTVADVNAQVGSAVTNINTNISSVVSKVVQLVEVDYTLTGTKSSGVTVTSGLVVISGITGNVLAVFDANGVQIEPDVKKVGSTITLEADYGSSTIDSKWTVLHTEAITYTAATYTNATAVSATAVATAAYTGADDGTNADYTSVDAIADVTYANATVISAAKATDVTFTGAVESALDYKNA